MGKRSNFIPPKIIEPTQPSNISNASVQNISSNVTSNSSIHNIPSNVSTQNITNLTITNSSIQKISQNITSNLSIKNSTVLFLSLEKTESKRFYYKFIKLVGILNQRSNVYYSIDGRSYSICSNCNRFSVYIRTKINDNNLTVTAIDSQGNKDLRIYSQI